VSGGGGPRENPNTPGGKGWRRTSHRDPRGTSSVMMALLGGRRLAPKKRQMLGWRSEASMDTSD